MMLSDTQSNDFLRRIWVPNSSAQRAYIAAGGFSRETAIQATESDQCPGTSRELVAFGRKYIANVSKGPIS